MVSHKEELVQSADKVFEVVKGQGGFAVIQEVE
jgi:DNA repair exonuclease SbcCD ATPase subunit